MKRNINLLFVALAAMFALSCHNDMTIEMEGSNPPRDGYVHIKFETRCPDMTEVSTRGVDPDGVGQ